MTDGPVYGHGSGVSALLYHLGFGVVPGAGGGWCWDSLLVNATSMTRVMLFFLMALVC